MRVEVYAVGRLRQKHYRKAADDYIKRLDNYGRFAEVEIKAAKGAAGSDPGEVKRLEGERILKALPKGAWIVALDERGDQVTSEGLERAMSKRALFGQPHTVFVIGGANGLAPEVTAEANELLALSKMTLPHELARVFIWEQVYRAMTIARGEPYHK